MINGELRLPFLRLANCLNMNQIFTFSNIAFTDIKQLVILEEQYNSSYHWDDSAHLTEQEIWLINTIVNYIRDLPVHLLNEATIWARAIYRY